MHFVKHLSFWYFRDFSKEYCNGILFSFVALKISWHYVTFQNRARLSHAMGSLFFYDLLCMNGARYCFSLLPYYYRFGSIWYETGFFPFETGIIVGHKMDPWEKRMAVLKCLEVKGSWLSSSPKFKESAKSLTLLTGSKQIMYSVKKLISCRV